MEEKKTSKKTSLPKTPRKTPIPFDWNKYKELVATTKKSMDKYIEERRLYEENKVVILKK